MFNYAAVGSNNLEKARAFYDQLLGTIGMHKIFDHPSGGRLYGQFGVSAFGVLGPYDKQKATVGNGTTFGFGLKSRAEVDTFHAKAMSLGATDEGAPGRRGGENSPAYFAYFRDLDGNKLCAYHFGPPLGN
jgi:catechol 2,3-dioxygenase-like lactoylglutathione lyase family enzyme